jgi:hypothetical protein
MTYFVIWGVVSLVCGIAGYFLASAKNRDASAWAAWCFLFPPFILALVLARKSPHPPPRRPTLDELDRDIF